MGTIVVISSADFILKIHFKRYFNIQLCYNLYMYSTFDIRYARRRVVSVVFLNHFIILHLVPIYVCIVNLLCYINVIFFVY